MRLSDTLAQYIMDMLNEQGDARIVRNELAEQFGCVPSQINYVITSRFTPEQGYIVESRRGGGGYIRITRIEADNAQTLMHIINSVGPHLDNITSQIMIKNLVSRSIINSQAEKLLTAATSERSLMHSHPASRDAVRAAIFKNMLLALV